MELNESVFAVDPAALSLRLEAFIREQMNALRRDGIVVAISGGLDSSTVVTLCARAVGPGRVTGLMLPERKGNPDALRYARQVAERLGIRTEVMDISRVLAALGTYRFIGHRVGRGLVETALARLVPKARGRLFLAGVRGTRNPLVRQGSAAMYTKHRARLVVTCKYADERNLLVAGCAHKSEDMIGLFTKFGVDDMADIMPLKHLYRSHIVQIARYVGVPEEIIGRPPNPDMLPGIDDKYFDLLGIHAETVDLILYGLEQGLPPVEIAEQVSVPLARVQEIEELVRLTAHMRQPSMGLTV